MPACHAPRRAKRDESAECDRRTNDATRWLCDQSAEAETRRRSLWVDEDDRAVAEAAPSWRPDGRLDFPLRGGGLQPDSDSKSRLCGRLTAHHDRRVRG